MKPSATQFIKCNADILTPWHCGLAHWVQMPQRQLYNWTFNRYGNLYNGWRYTGMIRPVKFTSTRISFRQRKFRLSGTLTPRSPPVQTYIRENMIKVQKRDSSLFFIHVTENRVGLFQHLFKFKKILFCDRCNETSSGVLIWSWSEHRRFWYKHAKNLHFHS